MKVININGTSGNTCKCGSWLEHWEKYSRQPLPSYCPVSSCYNKPEVGAHIQKDSLYDKKWYIIPLCKNCNAKTNSSLEVANTITLVSANVNETCG